MKKTMHHFLALCLLLTIACMPAKAGINQPDHFCVSYTLKYSYTKDSLLNFWKQKHIPQFAVKVKNAVDMYEVVYKGMWLDSTFIMAKGVLYVPKGTDPSAEMVYCHGTRISVDMGPGINDLEQVVCMMHAVDGYIAMFPYYYGLGGGEKEHVYQDVPTEASAAIYMIKACREIYPKIGRTTTGQLFLTGYSQGGHASMATHKVIEASYPEMKLTGSSPMSGAYDMVGVQAKTMFEPYNRPHYLPYLLISYQYAYHLWPTDIYSVFKSPYDSLFREVFKQPRHFDYGYVDKIAPHIPKDMVLDGLVERFRSDTSFVFSKKLRENGLWNWVPKAPMQLCACYADDEVLYGNTEKAYDYMHSHGAQINKHVFGKYLSHNPCAPIAILYTKYYFDNLRKGKKHPERLSVGRKLLIALATDQANHQAKKHLKKFGKIETDALASRSKKK